MLRGRQASATQRGFERRSKLLGARPDLLDRRSRKAQANMRARRALRIERVAGADRDAAVERGRLQIRSGHRGRELGPQIKTASRHLKLKPATMVSNGRDHHVAALPE